MDLGRAQDYFASKLWNGRGFTFQGQLMAAPVTELHTYFLLPRRMLKVGKTVSVLGGDIVTTVDGKYIVQEHATSELWDKVLYRTYRLYQITDRVQVSHDTEVHDTILGRSIANGTALLGPYDLVIETTSFEVEGGMENLNKRIRIISPVELPVGGIVDSKYRIDTIDAEGGIYLIRATKI